MILFGPKEVKTMRISKKCFSLFLRIGLLFGAIAYGPSAILAQSSLFNRLVNPSKAEMATKGGKTVIYRSKMNPVLKKNFAVFPVLDWILAITVHISNKGEQLVRYYGYYSNVSRGKRMKLIPEGEETSWKPKVIEVAPPPIWKERMN